MKNNILIFITAFVIGFTIVATVIRENKKESINAPLSIENKHIEKELIGRIYYKYFLIDKNNLRPSLFSYENYNIGDTLIK